MMRNSRQGKNTSKGTKTGQVGMVIGVETVQLIVTEAERIREGGLINEPEDVCRC